MESKILGGGGGFVQFSNFTYVKYYQLACFRHQIVCVVLDGFQVVVDGFWWL